LLREEDVVKLHMLTMERVLIVDGHSVLHATDWLLDLHRQNQGVARERLVTEMSEFQCVSDYSVVLVFDGQGSRIDKQGGSETEALVMYSRSRETADAVIEKLAVRHAVKYDVIVASNDRMVLDSCAVSGAHGVSVRGLWDLVDNTN